MGPYVAYLDCEGGQRLGNGPRREVRLSVRREAVSGRSR